MEQNLVLATRSVFTREVLTALERNAHASETEIQAGLNLMVPLALHTLIGRIEKPYGPEVFWKLSREAYGASVLEALARPGQNGWQQRSEGLMRDLVGDSYTAVVQERATAAGLDLAGATQLLSLCATAILGVAGDHAQEENLDPALLAGWVAQEKDAVRRALLGGQPLVPAERQRMAAAPPAPAALPPTLSEAAIQMPPAASGPYFTPSTSLKGSSVVRWQWGGLLLLAVLLGYVFGQKRTGTDAAAPSTAPIAAVLPAVAATEPKRVAGRYDDASGNYIYDTGQPIILRLADGTTQKVGANSTENRLFTFLADPAIQVDSVNRTKGWINFDRVYFEPGATTLTDESFMQLRNVASILKTFPTSVVKLGGYTDSTGNPLKNFQLSEERAKTAMLAMAGMGIDMNRIQAKGYGGKYFITPNTTPEGRALNRRISIRVIKK